MELNNRTIQYLKDMEAILIDSYPKITSYNFFQNKVYIQTISYYKKRNGKQCRVEHNDGKWIPFNENIVKFRRIKYITYESSLYGLEEKLNIKTERYLSKEDKEILINKFKS